MYFSERRFSALVRTTPPRLVITFCRCYLLSVNCFRRQQRFLSDIPPSLRSANQERSPARFQSHERSSLPRRPTSGCFVERRAFVPKKKIIRTAVWSKPAVKLAALPHREQCGLSWLVSCTFRVDGEPRGRQIACGRVQLD